MHQMIFGAHPFKTEIEVKFVDYKIPFKPRIKDETANMLTRCLLKNPNDRLSIQDLRNHPAFSSCQEKLKEHLGENVKKSYFGNNKIYREIKKNDNLNKNYFSTQRLSENTDDNKQLIEDLSQKWWRLTALDKLEPDERTNEQTNGH